MPAPSANDADAQADDAVRALEPLLRPEGWTLLNTLPPYREKDALRLGATLREAGHDPALVSAALTQSRLRARATEKFGEFAASMLFTPHGLEQATRLPVAALHAERFAKAEVGSVADLGCGIGGDSMALAGLGMDVLAVDRDPATVAVATVNLRPFPNARVRLGRAEGHDPTQTEGIWLDPARRAVSGRGTRRLHDPEQYEPPLSAVIELAARLGSLHGGTELEGPCAPSGHGGSHVRFGALGAKLGPAIDRELLPAGTETQWLSWHGQVLEATCWFGPLATPGTPTSALVVDRDGAHLLTARTHGGGPARSHGAGANGDESDESVGPPAAAGAGDRADSGEVPGDPQPGPLGDHLYEPDGAVIRAGLIGRLARDLDAHTLDPTIAYLTGDLRTTTPFARGYAVRDVMPFSLKRLTSYLKEHRLGVLEIKKRGTAVEPEELRRRLRPRRFGEESATLVLTRIAGEQMVVVTSPHGHSPAGGTGSPSGGAQ
ncbi:THUMP-like domain-containing protein [Brachybacterium epidermidis]|uniref:THUMP-like domain-containing protein n=1 Tax=Brachybacterium epidermidis TaxID=2781983 RepID=UPI00398E73DB